MKIYNSKKDLLKENKDLLADIILYQNCILQIPEIQLYMKDNAIKNAKKKCECCAEICCIKYPMDK